MLNIDGVEKVYLACGVTDLRKSIDGFVMIVQNQLKLDPFDKALFVFCNKKMDKLKILHCDEGFWLYSVSYTHLSDFIKGELEYECYNVCIKEDGSEGL